MDVPEWASELCPQNSIRSCGHNTQNSGLNLIEQLLIRNQLSEAQHDAWAGACEVGQHGRHRDPVIAFAVGVDLNVGTGRITEEDAHEVIDVVRQGIIAFQNIADVDLVFGEVEIFDLDREEE